jgi:glycosyltransferase involved in cell wall biosynthesis
VEVLLKALTLLPPRSGGPDLWIVGDGEHRGALEAVAANLGLGARVRFLGRRPAGEIRWALQRTHALVVPSIYEGMPLVVLEAMAAGRPVVASAVSGIPEVVRDGETGWLVPPEDPAALASALAALAADPAEGERRGREGRRRFELDHRPEKVAAIWEDTVTRPLERTVGERG